MNAIQSKAVVTGICFLLIFVSGYWLSRSGKPYPVGIFTLHKLITLGVMIYLAVTLSGIHKVAPLQGGQIAVVALTAVCFLAMLASGGMLSVEKVMQGIVMPGFVHRVHQVLPYLTAASAGAMLYLTLFVKAVP